MSEGSRSSLTQLPQEDVDGAPAFRVVDITEAVADAVQVAGVTDGLACVYSPTTGNVVRLHESETGLLEDFARLLARLVPDGKPGRRASLIAMLIGPAGEVVPVSGGRLALGQWQRVLLIVLGEEAQEEAQRAEPAWLVRVVGS